MKFFKHFADAHRGQSLKQLVRKKGMDGVGRYWTLVELCAEKLEKSREEELTEAHCVFVFDRGYIRDTLQTHQFSSLEMFLRCLTDLRLMSFECVGDVLTISMPKLLECIDRDAKRARPVRGQCAPKIEDKDKDIYKGGAKPARRKPARVEFKNSEELKSALGQDWLIAQSEIYPDDFYRERELKKAFLWFQANPRKCPTTIGGWKTKLSGWYDRGWEKHQNSIPSRSANPDIVER